MVKKALFLTLSSTLIASAEERPSIGSIVPHDASFSELIDTNAKIEVLASGFIWSEGPAWDKDNNRILFSDVPKNTVYQWSEKEGLSVYLTPSGYTGPSEYSSERGSNGLAFNPKGQLLSCEHGDRRVSILSQNGGGKITLADRVDG